MDTPEAQTPTSWTAHPARDQPGRAVAALITVLVVCFFVWLTVGGAEQALLASMAAGFAGAVLLASLSRFFLESRFEMDAVGITARYPFTKRSFKWTDLRRFIVDRNGGYLSTRRNPSRWDAFSGMQVLFRAVDRETIQAAIRARLELEASQ